ncbi:hypothetical protein AA0311_0257 [Asaia bogorensis NBRC 16594]|uniref:Uncharacterized protein n=1 Tax=Asaia bogorensis NBRC 16594 TaxID=1231624 RepID=A0AAN4U272_9PROT|nr:hypothetical protein AA0311_0257 [Asaia bogorensis NBRC 16594]GEL53339.1 hypothetical protein ABO01nite_13460 [Asaia bogorensis NBRC 16594]
MHDLFRYGDTLGKGPVNRDAHRHEMAAQIGRAGTAHRALTAADIGIDAYPIPRRKARDRGPDSNNPAREFMAGYAWKTAERIIAGQKMQIGAANTDT